MSKRKFDPGDLTLPQVQQVFRYLGVEVGFVLVPNPETEMWEKAQQDLETAVADVRALLKAIRRFDAEVPGSLANDAAWDDMVEQADRIEAGKVSGGSNR